MKEIKCKLVFDEGDESGGRLVFPQLPGFHFPVEFAFWNLDNLLARLQDKDSVAPKNSLDKIRHRADAFKEHPLVKDLASRGSAYAKVMLEPAVNKTAWWLAVKEVAESL